MRLIEDAIFGANQLRTVQKIYRQSSIKGVVTSNDDEKTLVKNILLKLGVRENGASAYLCVKAASFGSDDENNRCLSYVKSINSNEQIMRRFPEKVSHVIDLISKNEIEAYEDIFLRNVSLYNRNDNAFDYAVKAFDAVLYKRDDYFESNNGTVNVGISPDVAKNFFDFSSAIARDDDILNVDVKIDQKFFFNKKEVSETDLIIPSGVGSGDSNKRTIWNYMEIWTTFSEDEEQEKLKDRDDIKDRAKEIINKSNMTDDDKKIVNALMSRL